MTDFMEKEINNLKQLYLETVPPVSDKDGLMDLMQRLGKQKHIPPLYFPRVFIVVGVLFLMASGLVAASYLLPHNSALNSVRAVSQNALQTIFRPVLETTLPLVKDIEVKKLTPTLFPTPVSTEHKNEKTQGKDGEKSLNKKIESYEKKVEGITTDNKDEIKGISDSNQKNGEKDNNNNNENRNSNNHAQNENRR